MLPGKEARLRMNRAGRRGDATSLASIRRSAAEVQADNRIRSAQKFVTAVGQHVQVTTRSTRRLLS
jgi:hypothetical protein